jgi:hypothetical protein
MQMQCSQALDLRQQRALVSAGGQCNVLKLSCLRNENARGWPRNDTGEKYFSNLNSTFLLLDEGNFLTTEAGRTPGEHCLVKKETLRGNSFALDNLHHKQRRHEPFKQLVLS